MEADKNKGSRMGMSESANIRFVQAVRGKDSVFLNQSISEDPTQRTIAVLLIMACTIPDKKVSHWHRC